MCPILVYKNHLANHSDQQTLFQLSYRTAGKAEEER